MKLQIGEQLGNYRIIEMIGKGGMGEVYRATDTRLPREVAIKTSGERFSERFAREARVIASLNHPNICTLFDVGPDYLVMELVEGPTLADRISQGALSLKEAATVGQQIADALEYAHEKGVVHRDLKPGNVKIRPDGLVKVLDFGLAKFTAGGDANEDSDATVTMGLTQEGTVLGTAAYMSPEQARGQAIDRRADVWAFGVVFYEMLAGVRPFRRKTVAETLASVLHDEPELSGVPAQAHRLLKRCLEKDPNRRLRHVGDVIALLDDGSGSGAVAARSVNWGWPAVAAVSVVVAAAALWAAAQREPAEVVTARFEIGPAQGTTLASNASITISPDGKWMAFPAVGEEKRSRYWVRPLDGVGLRPVGTDIDGVAEWSLDGRSLIFGIQDKLKKIDVQGGAPITIAGNLPGRAGLAGASENAEGVLLVGCAVIVESPILRVPVGGGTLTAVTKFAPGDRFHVYPQFLPDGKHFLYQRITTDAAKAGVYVGSLDLRPEEQSAEPLLAGPGKALFAAGHLLFVRGTTLMAQPFDPAAEALSGEAIAIADGVDPTGSFSVSQTGTLVYHGGAGASNTVLTWFDAQGNVTGTLGNPGEYTSPAISPDGSRVAVAVGPARDRDIWILDTAKGGASRFTFSAGADENPVWSPDGREVVFSSTRDHLDLFIKPADGSGEERLLVESGEPKRGYDWSLDGRHLLFESEGPKTMPDLWALPMSPQGAPVGVLKAEFSERMPRLSPDGRWLAYVSYESGTADVYVRPFSPGTSGGEKWLVSNGLSVHPRWSPDGKQLYYIKLGGQVTAVDIDTRSGFRAGAPRVVFRGVPPTLIPGWDLSRDGKRFLFVTAPRTGSTVPFTVVLNWAAGLKK
jgi:Tol biopolymer transport system component/predicted Ser/Thr protein kinase